jgi:ATP synthase protein I
MSLPPESREEAIARLNKSASDLEARTTPKASAEMAGHAAASQAWKIVADLLGGVFVGLALGFGVDHFAGTRPWGLLGGVLVGFAISVWMAWRTAQRLMAEANQYGEPPSVPFDDDEDQGA